MSDKATKLGLGALAALVVGSMVGGGIFDLPQNVSESAGVGATLIGWAITGVGMLTLAFVFQTLANRKPDLDGGVYIYAKQGFGDYMGFSSAWGYWMSAWLGNVSYMVLLFTTLGYFFPGLLQVDPETGVRSVGLIAIIGASVLLWVMHFMILRGVKEATFINSIVTVAKLAPLVIFIFAGFLAFKLDIFTADIWAVGNPELGSVMTQVKSMMMVTAWVFIGIEGASIFSGRARKRSDVGKATVLGFLGVLSLLVLVNVLSLGIMSQAQLAGLQSPSLGAVLEHAVGPWGGILISVGVCVSLLGALLSWVLLCAEILFTAATDKTMPAFLGKVNKNDVPANGLWLSNAAVQVFLIITLFSGSTYLSLIKLATSMVLVPYLWSAAYALLLCVKHETYETDKASWKKDVIIAVIAVVYAIWLLYAGGLKYILLSTLLYAPGALLFFKAKREANKPVFTMIEKVIFAGVLISAIIAAVQLYQGSLTI